MPFRNNQKIWVYITFHLPGILHFWTKIVGNGGKIFSKILEGFVDKFVKNFLFCDFLSLGVEHVKLFPSTLDLPGKLCSTVCTR